MAHKQDDMPFSPDDISEWFWDLNRRAQGQSARLEAILMQMPAADIARFYEEFKEAACQLQDTPFSDNLVGLSEDSIEDIAEWVVSQGKEYFSRVWRNPASIPRQVPPGTASTFSGVAESVYWEKYQQSIHTEA